MKKQRLAFALVPVSLVAAACSALDAENGMVLDIQAAGESSATVGLDLTIPGGYQVSTVSYTLTDGTHTYSKALNVADAGVISFVVPDVQSGPGYSVTLTATSDDGVVSCSGQQGPFSVSPRTTTFVNVQMVCVDLPNQEAGGVLVNGIVDCCPTWDTMVANPSPVPQAGSTLLTGHASGPCASADGGQQVNCTWTVIAGRGTLTQPGTDGDGTFTAVFSCPPLGETETLQLACTDGPLPDGGACPAISTTGTMQVNCGGIGYSVVRIGDGTVVPGKNFEPSFIENHAYGTADALLSTVSLPTSVPDGGLQEPFTLMGSATNDGALSRSVDGHYLTLGGYGSPQTFLTSGNPLLSATNPRVVARIDALNHVDTSTVFAMPNDAGVGGAFNGAAIRSTATVDGTSFWAAGTDNTTGGVYFIPFGAQFDGTQLNSTDTRVINVVGSQLVADATQGFGLPELFTVGNGLPDGGAAADVALPGFPSPNTTTSPWQFAALDLLPSVPGVDTIYVATDQTPGGSAPPNGIEKWTFDGTTWSLQTIFNVAPSVSTPLGMRGLAAQPTGGTAVTLIATTIEGTTNPPIARNHVVLVNDSGGPYPSGADGGPSVTLTGTFIAQAPLNTLYRGVALSPF